MNLTKDVLARKNRLMSDHAEPFHRPTTRLPDMYPPVNPQNDAVAMLHLARMMVHLLEWAEGRLIFLQNQLIDENRPKNIESNKSHKTDTALFLRDYRRHVLFLERSGCVDPHFLELLHELELVGMSMGQDLAQSRWMNDTTTDLKDILSPIFGAALKQIQLLLPVIRRQQVVTPNAVNQNAGGTA